MRSIQGFLLVVFFSTNTYAAQSTTEIEVSHRMDKRIGVTIQSYSHPIPHSAGIGVHYNITDYLRGDFSYSPAASSGSGLSQIFMIGPSLLIPAWDITPTIGLRWATTFGDGWEGSDVMGVDGKHLMSVIGLDWQAEVGLNLSGGYYIPLQGEGKFAPYFQAGWFF